MRAFGIGSIDVASVAALHDGLSRTALHANSTAIFKEAEGCILALLVPFHKACGASSSKSAHIPRHFNILRQNSLRRGMRAQAFPMANGILPMFPRLPREHLGVALALLDIFLIFLASQSVVFLYARLRPTVELDPTQYAGLACSSPAFSFRHRRLADYMIQ